MPIRRIKKLVGDLHYLLNVRDHALVSYLSPIEKRERLANYASRCQEFVETGTYLGETTAAMAKHYSKVHTIEIDTGLYEKARARFADQLGIQCYHGDSATMLPEVIRELAGPTVFWLDGHYSGPRTGRHSEYDTPIISELEMIFAHNAKDHIILIDDARLFVGRHAYPTIAILRQFVSANSRYHLTIRDDIIRLWFDPEWS